MRNPTTWFPNMPNTNRAVQALQKARSWKFWTYVERDCIIRLAKPKALISSSVTAQLISVRLCFQMQGAVAPIL